jgi:uncharacterized protein involved in exopolysaccharide biosynthesis
MGGYRFRDFVSAFRRRFWILAVAVVLLSPLALAIAYFLPARFESTARILVQAQQIPTTLARPTVTASALERVNQIKQQLMTREVLVEIVQKHNLYANRTDLSLADKVQLIRDNTVIQNVTMQLGGRNTPATLAAFTITFGYGSSRLAAAVANEFATRFLAENVEVRENQTSEALSFFVRETEELGRALAAKEAEISLFQQVNDFSLPANVPTRRQELAAIEARAKTYEQQLLTMREQKRGLEEGLRLGTTLAGQALSPQQQQLQNLQNQLAQSQALLAPTHPQIVSLQAQIAALQKAVAASTAPTAPKSAATLQTENQIALLEKQIAYYEGEQRKDAERRVEIEAAIAASPDTGMRLAELNRQLAELQAKYQAAVTKRNEAEIGAALEVSNQAERFVLADPAYVPEAPVSPQRLLIAAGGVVASLVIGLGLMALAEVTDRSIRTANVLEHRTGLRPVVSIPYVMTRGERQMRRLRWALFLLFFLVALPAAVWSLDRYYLPLDVLVEQVAEKTGLNGLIRIIEIRLGG